MTPEQHRQIMIEGYRRAGVSINPRTVINGGRPSIELPEPPDWYQRVLGTGIHFYHENANSKLISKPSKVKRKNRRKKMSKFIKFADQLVNVCDVHLFKVNDPECASRKIEVNAVWGDGSELDEYFNTIEEAETRLEEIYNQIKG